jgi:hypothetical protein
MSRCKSMSDWRNEDDIKAELRVLTGELKRLREELRSMVSPPKPNPSRAFLHRQGWPAPRSEPPAEAAEKPPPRGNKKR